MNIKLYSKKLMLGCLLLGSVSAQAMGVSLPTPKAVIECIKPEYLNYFCMFASEEEAITWLSAYSFDECHEYEIFSQVMDLLGECIVLNKQHNPKKKITDHIKNKQFSLEQLSAFYKNIDIFALELLRDPIASATLQSLIEVQKKENGKKKDDEQKNNYSKTIKKFRKTISSTFDLNLRKVLLQEHMGEVWSTWEKQTAFIPADENQSTPSIYQVTDDGKHVLRKINKSHTVFDSNATQLKKCEIGSTFLWNNEFVIDYSIKSKSIRITSIEIDGQNKSIPIADANFIFSDHARLHGSSLILCVSHEIQIYNLKNLNEIVTSIPFQMRTQNFVVTRDAKQLIIAGNSQSSYESWDIATGEKIKTFPTEERIHSSSPGGLHISTINDDTGLYSIYAYPSYEPVFTRIIDKANGVPWPMLFDDYALMYCTQLECAFVECDHSHTIDIRTGIVSRMPFTFRNFFYLTDPLSNNFVMMQVAVDNKILACDLASGKEYILVPRALNVNSRCSKSENKKTIIDFFEGSARIFSLDQSFWLEDLEVMLEIVFKDVASHEAFPRQPRNNQASND